MSAAARILVEATPLALQGYHRAGAWRYCLELLRHLPAVAPAEWRLQPFFHFFRRRHLAGMRSALELAGHDAPVLSRWHPRLVRALGWPIERLAGPVDLFHGAFDRLPRCRRAARVLTVHDLAFRRAPEGLPPQWVAELEATVPPSVAAADRILAVSEFTRRDLIERLGADPERVHVAHHGVGPEMRPPADPERDADLLRRRFGLEPGYLLQLGTLQPNKNIEGLCAAYQILRRRGCKRPLVLAGGPGWMFEPMWRRIVARGDDRGVVRLGYVADEDVPLLYGSCAAFALVSRLEGFGIPVLEAMACGAPVVAADACSLPEVAGDAALLAPPDDPAAIAAALERAAEPGPERERLRAAGRRRAAGFTWRRSAEAHVEVYRLALADAADRR
ncbi:MAG: glycosyltransferase family 1 protein [Planctomycetota bacterium]|nr:MAG: glycosyltransferase family 1 protein [Planctomycetota bacterium]